MNSVRPVIIETRDLSKHYGSITAVDKLNLRIYEGEIFGLLGPNGAGKTTTILMILGLTEPTGGQVLVAGHDATREPLAVKGIVGYLPDNVGFYNDLTGWENLAYTAALNRIAPEEADRRIARALELVGLEKEAGRKVGEYSRGMRQRLGIADVMIKNPRVVILDEPTLGIDPKGVQELLALIVRLSREQGLTVLISSHQLHQVQQICDRVGIFVRGKLLVEGPIASLGRQMAAGKPPEIELQAEPSDERLVALLRSFDEVESIEPLGGDRLLLRCRGAGDIRPRLVRQLTAQGIDILYLRARAYDLDDIYRRYFQGDETYV